MADQNQPKITDAINASPAGAEILAFAQKALAGGMSLRTIGAGVASWQIGSLLAHVPENMRSMSAGMIAFSIAVVWSTWIVGEVLRPAALPKKRMQDTHKAE